jgi:hypothetical protein
MNLSFAATQEYPMSRDNGRGFHFGVEAEFLLVVID